MKARQSSVSITYDGKTTSILNLKTTAFTYTDPASGEADSLDISFFAGPASIFSGGQVPPPSPSRTGQPRATTAPSTAAPSSLTVFHIRAGRGQAP